MKWMEQITEFAKVFGGTLAAVYLLCFLALGVSGLYKSARAVFRTYAHKGEGGRR